MLSTVSRPALLSATLVIIFGIASAMAGDWSPWVGGFLSIFVIAVLLLSREYLTLGRSWRSPWRWMLILLIIFGFTIPWAGDSYAALRTWVYWFVGAACFATARAVDRSYRRQVLQFFVWLGAIGSVWAVVQFVRFGKLDRAGGFLENANAFGGYAILLIPLAVGLIRMSRGWRRRLLIVSVACIAIAFVLSFSVTGIVALVLAGILAFLMSTSVTRRRSVWLTLGIVFVLGLSGISIRYFQSKNFSEAIRLDQVITAAHFQSSFSQRWEFNTVALAMIRDYPLTGVGLGSYQQSFTQYATSRLEQPRYTHNAYLEVAAEGGVISFCALAFFLWFLARAIYRTYASSNSERALLAGAAVGLLASTFHGLFDFSWHFPAVWVGFWIIAGLTVARSQEAQRVRGERAFRFALAVVCVLLVVRGFGIALSYLPFQRADQQVEAGEFGKAIQNFNNGLRWDPDPTRMTKLASILWVARPENEQSLSTAQTWVEQAMRWSTINYATYQNLARIAVAKKKIPRAADAYAYMLQIDRHFHPDATAEYINFLRSQGRTEDADAVKADAEQAYVDILQPGESLFGNRK